MNEYRFYIVLNKEDVYTWGTSNIAELIAKYTGNKISTIKHKLQSSKPIYPITLNAFNELCTTLNSAAIGYLVVFKKERRP